HPFAAQPQRGAGLRSFGNLHRLLAVERRHLDLSAERHCREVDRDLAEEIVAVAAEELVLLHLNHHVQVSGRSAERTRFTFALQPQLLTGCNARRNLDRELSIARDPSRAAARLARLGDNLSCAAALRAGSGDGEEALLESHLALAAALRT